METGNTMKSMVATAAVLTVGCVLAAGALGLAGCREGMSRKWVPDPEFVDLYVELKLATVVIANDLDKVNETRRVILAQHGFTPSGFHDRYVELMAHPEAWRSFQEQVLAKVEEYQVSRKGDTANGK